MGGFEEDVKIQPSLIAFEFLKRSGHDGAGEARLVPCEDVSFAGQGAGARTLRRRGAPESFFPLPMTIMCAGTVMFIVEVKRLIP